MPDERGFLQPGSTVAGYTIIRLIGSGGMGQVYLAQHPRLPRHDAIKGLYPHLVGDESFRARFKREANLAAQLSHPNIVPVYDAGEDDGILWMSMQFIDGIDAARLIRDHPLGVDAQLAIDIVTQAARGLDRAHSRGMLHRDIKPGNLLLTGNWDSDDSGSHHVLVSDFGIARSLANTTSLTNTGSILATISYAAPEILQAQNVDHRADIYALGCTLFELLTGFKPYPRPDTAAVMLAHITDPPPRPTVLRPELPAAIDDVIATAMAKDPNQRYQTARDLANAARSALSGGVPVPPPPAPAPAPNSDETWASPIVAPSEGAPETVANQMPPIPTAGRQAENTPSTPPPPPPRAAAPMFNAPPQAPAPYSSNPPAKSGRPNKAVFALAGVAILAAAGGATWIMDKNSHDSANSSSAAGSTTLSAETSAVPADEQCTDAIKSNPLWVCLTSAKMVNGELVVEYEADWAGTTPNINGGYHIHLWGSDGSSPDVSTMGMQSSTPGHWVIKDTNPAVLTADQVAEAVGDSPKVCARIANSKHELKNDTNGGYDTGNCIPIER